MKPKVFGKIISPMRRTTASPCMVVITINCYNDRSPAAQHSISFQLTSPYRATVMWQIASKSSTSVMLHPEGLWTSSVRK